MIKTYYPILRGKQNELLALRELLNEGNLSKQIVPVVEPVKATPTFRILLASFHDKQRDIAVIQNSKVTEYTEFSSSEIAKLKRAKNFLNAYYLTSNSDINLLSKCTDTSISIVDELSNFEDFQAIKNRTPHVIINVANQDAIRSARETNGLQVISLNDHFNKQDRNSDYSNFDDEKFSSEHLYYKNEGYSGFSDYSVIGNNYSESGFAPKAVAIHLVYFDTQKKLRIHHFVSDSTEDITNPAGKFAEALKKMINWINNFSELERKMNYSSALEDFKRMYENGSYSGLGVIKKLSIKHHLEILGRFLGE